MTEERPLTGRKVLLITVTAFGVILGANMALLYAAVGSFPGLEVKNSYVASQAFDDERAAQASLGWDSTVEQDGKRLLLTLHDRTGAPVRPAYVSMKIGRATHVRDDHVVDLTYTTEGYSGSVDLAPGIWTIWIEAEGAGGVTFRQKHSLNARVAG